jgi:hypothetical protein
MPLGESRLVNGGMVHGDWHVASGAFVPRATCQSLFAQLPFTSRESLS